jgi:hypothetical protein
MQEVAALPEADQERIGRDVLSYVEKLRRLREKIDKAAASLARGEGKPLDIEDVIRRAHLRHGRA